METTYNTTDDRISDSDNRKPLSISIAAGPNPPPATNDNAPANGRSNTRTRDRGGAPRGNQNRTTHGLKGSQFPPKSARDQSTVRKIVNAAHDAVVAMQGQPLTVHQSAVLHRLRRAATKDRLAARWLRLEADKLSIEQRMALTDAMTAAAETMEKCLRLLKLDSDSGSGSTTDWAALLAAERPAAMPQSFSLPRNPPAATQNTSEGENVPPCTAEKRQPTVSEATACQ